jgi:hypothetical protein
MDLKAPGGCSWHTTQVHPTSSPFARPLGSRPFGLILEPFGQVGATHLKGVTESPRIRVTASASCQ